MDRDREMNHTGTRYQHFRDILDDLEEALQVVADDVGNAKYVSTQKKEQLKNLTITYEVMSRYFNSISGQNDTTNEYKLYQMVEAIPDIDKIED